MAEKKKPIVNSPKFEQTVEALEALLRRHGMAHLLAAFALLTRRTAEHFLKVNRLQENDDWMGLYARLRSLYESKAVPAAWPRPTFRWF